MKYGWRYSLSHGWYGKGILGEQFESQHPKQQEILILRIVKDDPPKGASRFSHCPRNGKLLEWILKSNQKWPLKKNQTELTIIWLGKVWDTPTRLNPMTHSLQSNSEAWLAWVESSTFRSVWWNNACLCDVTLKKHYILTLRGKNQWYWGSYVVRTILCVRLPQQTWRYWLKGTVVWRNGGFVKPALEVVQFEVYFLFRAQLALPTMFVEICFPLCWGNFGIIAYYCAFKLSEPESQICTQLT